MVEFAERWEKIIDVGEDYKSSCPRKLAKKQCSFWIHKQVFPDGKILYAGSIKFRELTKYQMTVPSLSVTSVIADGFAKIHKHYGTD